MGPNKNVLDTDKFCVKLQVHIQIDPHSVSLFSTGRKGLLWLLRFKYEVFNTRSAISV